MASQKELSFITTPSPETGETISSELNVRKNCEVWICKKVEGVLVVFHLFHIRVALP